MNNISNEEPGFVYAGFWKRFAALLLDSIFLTLFMPVWFIPYVLLFFPMQILENNSQGYEFVSQNLNNQFNDPLLVVKMTYFISGLYFINILIGWIYSTVMESMPKQGTLGKLIVGIKVTDKLGRRISFARATGRYFAKFFSAAFLMIGYIMAAFTAKKQAFHDIVAETLILDSTSRIFSDKINHDTRF